MLEGDSEGVANISDVDWFSGQEVMCERLVGLFQGAEAHVNPELAALGADSGEQLAPGVFGGGCKGEAEVIGRRLDAGEALEKV